MRNQFTTSTMTANQALRQIPKKHKYLGFGKYTKDCPQWFLKKFEKIDKNQLFSWFLAEAGGIVYQELDRKKFKVKTTRIWRKSRFISAHDILKKRLRTCATMSVLLACGLRHLGVPVKLVHGYFKQPHEKFRHAWNEIYFLDVKKFIPVDLTHLNFALSRHHIKLKECVDWEELEGREWDVARRYAH